MTTDPSDVDELVRRIEALEAHPRALVAENARLRQRIVELERVVAQEKAWREERRKELEEARERIVVLESLADDMTKQRNAYRSECERGITADPARYIALRCLVIRARGADDVRVLDAAADWIAKDGNARVLKELADK